MNNAYLFFSHSSLPITSPQGHVLGRLHIKVELDVARAGHTHLLAPETLSTLPGFTVGPGASLRETHSELLELSSERVHGSLQKRSTTTSNDEDSRRNGRLARSSEAVAAHKAALLAKYIGHHPTESSRHCLGPKQHEVLTELIGRGERLRDAMVASVLNSGKGGDREESGRGRGGGGGKGTTEEQGVRQEYVYSSDEDEFGESEFSLDESDYPLHNPSLLEQLLYTVRLQCIHIHAHTCIHTRSQTHPHIQCTYTLSAP